VREKAQLVAAGILEAPAAEIELANGAAFVRGVPARAVPLGDVALAANPLRFAMPAEWDGPGLEAIRYFAPPQGTFANGVHACIVEADPETGTLVFHRYVVVHDCGRVINPTVLEGQIHGGVAQGLGGAFWEQLVYDEQAQPLSTTFMDYLLPTAADLPPIDVDHLETPSPLNPLGVKGAGEAGAIGSCPAVVNAIIEGLWREYRIDHIDMPATPERVWIAIREHQRRHSL
jgi:CO/xanthine dehydrogenase Mo-binding subunit